MNLHARKIPVLTLLPFALALFSGCGGHSASSQLGSSGPTPAPGPASPGVPASAVTIPDIQKLGAWQSCTACTSSAFARFSMAKGIATPSMSGSSARFSLLPRTLPFGGALWFKFLTTDDNATHFVYDLFFYTDQPSAPQALEFNVSQSTGGQRYSFATQCDLSVQRAWMVWNTVAHGWLSTGVPCVQPPPKTWNHLVWEFNRNSSGQAVFAAVTLNGDRKEIGITMPPTPDKSSGIDVAFQLDANRTATPYSVWLDRMSLSYW